MDGVTPAFAKKKKKSVAVVAIHSYVARTVSPWGLCLSWRDHTVTGVTLDKCKESQKSTQGLASSLSSWWRVADSLSRALLALHHACRLHHTMLFWKWSQMLPNLRFVTFSPLSILTYKCISSFNFYFSLVVFNCFPLIVLSFIIYSSRCITSSDGKWI